MTLKDNYLKLSKKFGGPYYLVKKGIEKGWIVSILRGSDISISRVYEISKVLGVTMEELYPGGPQAERISEHPELYALPEYPYTPEEQRYIGLLVGILRGKNQKNARAIKENIEAFHYSKDMQIGVVVETGLKPVSTCQDAAPKKTAENGK